ncbi:hypothetical protein [Changchengzhania lutea]|uniref:hypothetical protein n=1 Tax=Changchengzhania lutea TaxID=2049305 RepID=UPI00115D36B2|nr:hypothetical protein [Changchengzhania lutea]
MKATLTTKSPLLKELLELLKELVTLHSVYVLSVLKEKKKQNTYLSPQNVTSRKIVTYTLLIITHKPISKGQGNFMDDLYNKMQQRCKVYTIMYTLSKVKKRLNYGDDFLSQAIFHTSCMYKSDDSLSKFSNYGSHFHPCVYKGIQEVWKGRMERAEYLLTILNTIEPEEDSTSRLAIMHYALEQICMALLYVFWEFKPQHYTLPYLLHLCSHFTRIPQTIFPKETYGLHRMYYMLCNAHHIMRFKVQNEFSDMDTDKAYSRCELFFDEAKTLGEAQLEHLKNLHCKSSNQ